MHGAVFWVKHPPQYAASTLLGSSVYVASRQLALPLAMRIAIAASAVGGFRVAAKQYSIHLPSWAMLDAEMMTTL